jgi:hypothetical protein
MAGHRIEFSDGSVGYIDYADAEGSAVVNGRVWRWEFSECGGPLFLRSDLEPRKCQCPTVKEVWNAFDNWLRRYEKSRRKNKSRKSKMRKHG